MPLKIRSKSRYIQIAFNGSKKQVQKILPQIPKDPRIIIEAGTPYIKRTGTPGIRYIRRLWSGLLVADLKINDGAVNEVLFATRAGANAITALGSAPVETLDLFTQICATKGIYSIIDMLGVNNPLNRILPLKKKPDFVVIHKGRDEESNARNMIRYKDISKFRSKFNILISVAGGLELKNVRKAYFNGANVAIFNIVGRNDLNSGIYEDINFSKVIPSILSDIRI